MGKHATLVTLSPSKAVPAVQKWKGEEIGVIFDEEKNNGDGTSSAS
jgi:hypothetical protein